MEERNITSLRKELRFEKSEDAFSIEITIENASSVSKEGIVGFLDAAYASMIKEFLGQAAT